MLWSRYKCVPTPQVFFICILVCLSVCVLVCDRTAIDSVGWGIPATVCFTGFMFIHHKLLFTEYQKSHCQPKEPSLCMNIVYATVQIYISLTVTNWMQLCLYISDNRIVMQECCSYAREMLGLALTLQSSCKSILNWSSGKLPQPVTI